MHYSLVTIEVLLSNSSVFLLGELSDSYNKKIVGVTPSCIPLEEEREVMKDERNHHGTIFEE